MLEKKLAGRRDMELASAHLHKGQVPWFGLLLTGKEIFLPSREQGSSETGWGLLGEERNLRRDIWLLLEA